jgi:hypothetical protein
MSMRKRREYMDHLDAVTDRTSPMNKSPREIAQALRSDPSYEQFGTDPRRERTRDVLKSAAQINAFVPLDWGEFIHRAIPWLKLKTWRDRSTR